MLEGVYLVMYYQYQIWYTVLLDWGRSYELGQDISKSRDEYGGSSYQTTNSIWVFGLLI